MSANNDDVMLNELYTLDDETNPKSSEKHIVYPPTILDQVFDDLSPSKKNLRQIIADLRQEISSGGLGNIVFPVTSVNGKSGDVNLTANDFGLGRVDNTRDIDKPLSVPQRNALMEILQNYDFNINMDKYNSHMTDTNNPHNVKLEDINKDDILQKFVEFYISKHNFDTDTNVHMDIRRSLSKLWILADGINNTLDDRLDIILSTVNDHITDNLAHDDLFNKKEDVSNKCRAFTNDINNTHTKYPSNRAVIEYVEKALVKYNESHPDVEDWIDNICVIDDRDSLPPLNSKSYRKAYFIRHGISSYCEIAVCRKDPNGEYSWDISQLGSYWKFDPTYFTDSVDGITIKMNMILDAMISENGMLDESLSEILSKYYTKEDIDRFHYIDNIKILPGTLDGTIRYYINDDLTTMSDDVKIPGLKRLAYKEWITENELWDQAVHGRHIISQSIERRHIKPKSIDFGMMSCEYGKLIGNTEDPDGDDVNGITLLQLADWLRPLIGGWPDPTTPGGNPWTEMFNDRITSSQLWEPEVEHAYGDYSYAMRFIGKISVIPNMDIKIKLTDKVTIDECQLMDAGGAWCFQTDPEEWTILGGSNITGHTFATVNMTKDGLFLESISIGDRVNAKYDIWVKYIKKKDQPYLWNPEPNYVP